MLPWGKGCPIRVPSGTAPGYRSYTLGVQSSVGNGGFCYSSSVKGGNGMYLNFDVTRLDSGSSNSRAYGLQLRCLSE